MNYPRILALVVLPTLLAVTMVFLVGGKQAENTTAVRTEPIQWGLYQILWSRKYGEQLTKEIAKFASKPDYVMFYRDLGRPYPTFPIDCIAKHDAVPIVSLELWTWGGGRKGSYLDDINQGRYDEFFRDWARTAANDKRPVLLRFGFEFNGDWFTWSGDPKGYVEAWRRAHRIFREERAHHVQWVWAPNVTNCPDVPENDMHRYYPGDAYVDWIGLDGYNFGDDHDEWHTWQSLEKIYEKTLGELIERYPNKPISISEFGCASGSDRQRSQWIREAHAYLQRFPQVKSAIWFNYDKRREKEPNWRIDVTPESLRAFNETFAAPDGG